MARILIVDDEADIRNLIARYAGHESYQTAQASDGREALALCTEQDFDLIVMDIMMPGMDGFEASREIKKIKDIPFLMLSARGSERDKLEGFGIGADDYVVKPFSPKELMARINAILNRRKAQLTKSADTSQVLQEGLLRIDMRGHTVSAGGEKLSLTSKEYDVLLFLAKNKDVAFSRDQIIDAVWGENYYADDRTVDWQVKLLRGKLGVCRDYIVTIRGVGYKFEVK